MMFARQTMTLAALLGALSLAGCASDGSGLSLTTGSVNNTTTTAQAKKSQVNLECVALVTQIDELRKEGTPGRIQKVALGKSKTVVVKRSALAKVSELEKANVQLQTKCSSYTPAQLRAASMKAQKKATTPVTKSKKVSALAPATKTATPAKTTSVVKKTVTAVKKTTTTTKKVATAPVTTQKVMTKKTVTAVKKSATGTMKAPIQLLTKPQAAATNGAKKAATTTTATAKTVTSTAKTAAKEAQETATKTAKTAAEPTAAFPSLGTGGFADAYGGGVVVTTTTP